MAGVGETIVQKLAGYAHMSTTLRSYTRLFPESSQGAREALPYASGGTLTPP